MQGAGGQPLFSAKELRAAAEEVIEPVSISWYSPAESANLGAAPGPHLNPLHLLNQRRQYFFDLLDVSIDPEFLDENDCVCRLRLQHRTKNHWLDRRMVKYPGIPWACSAVPLPPGIVACLPIYYRQPVVRAPRSNCTGTPSLFVSDSCGLLHR